MKLGIEKTALVRVSAGISYPLTEAMDEGHRFECRRRAWGFLSLLPQTRLLAG